MVLRVIKYKPDQYLAGSCQSRLALDHARVREEAKTGSEEGVPAKLAVLVRKDPDKVIRILHKGQVMSVRSRVLQFY